MQIILVILTSTLISGLLFFVYQTGYKKGKESKQEDGLVVNEYNQQFIEEMAKWRQYFGGKR